MRLFTRARGALLVTAAVAVWLVAGCSAGPVGDGGPDPLDFVQIADATPNPPAPAPGPEASTGTFTVHCGHNENGHNNGDNFIRRPGDHSGHLMHDYVGNLSTDAFSTDDSLAAAETTCSNGDRSTYYWPVLRLLGSGHGGHGSTVGPSTVVVRFHGIPSSKVVGMPRFLRVSTGNPRAVTDGGGVVRWTCSGSPDRSAEVYTMCPAGEQVVRVFQFPNCWDGRNMDSPNHRTHVVSAVGGVCPHRTFPIPALTLEIAYDVPAGILYAIDTFPEQRHSPRTDHADFTNVMTDSLMATLVDCVNRGQQC